MESPHDGMSLPHWLLYDPVESPDAWSSLTSIGCRYHNGQ